MVKNGEESRRGEAGKDKSARAAKNDVLIFLVQPELELGFLGWEEKIRDKGLKNRDCKGIFWEEKLCVGSKSTLGRMEIFASRNQECNFEFRIKNAGT
jgi:hypothetical protein